MDNRIILQSHIEDILKIVAENPGCNRETVYTQLEGSKGTKVKRVNQLIDEEHIKEIRLYGAHNIKTLEITDTGKRILEGIRIINGEAEDNFRASPNRVRI